MTLEFLLVCVACALTLNICVPAFEGQFQAQNLVRALDGYARAALIGAGRGDARRFGDELLAQIRTLDKRLEALRVSSVCESNPNCLVQGGLLRIDGDLGETHESVVVDLPAR